MSRKTDSDYYTARQPELLAGFDREADLWRTVLADRYGEEGADALYRAAREKYEEIIPQTPRIEGVRASGAGTGRRLGTSFLTRRGVCPAVPGRDRGGAS